MTTGNDKILRNRIVRITTQSTEAMATNEAPTNAYFLPYGPPPAFKGTPDEDINDWLKLYERYAAAMGWNNTQKVNSLVISLQGEARQWYVTQLRGSAAPAEESWANWQKALQRDFGGEHIQDWAFIQLQERRQQAEETPQQYVSSMLQLCSRANPAMTDPEKVRCLLRGLRPEMMERVAITNPRTPAEFLQHLQRLTHVGAMARHALLTMPTHPLPGFAASPALATFHAGEERQRVAAPSTSQDTAAILGALQDSLRTLTTAIERMGQTQSQRFPVRRVRGQGGQPVCFHCRRPGHIMRQCQQRFPQPTNLAQLPRPPSAFQQPTLDQQSGSRDHHIQQPLMPENRNPSLLPSQFLPAPSSSGTNQQPGNGIEGV